MKAVHAYNLHRGGGGADNATRATIRVLRDAGVAVTEFMRDSATLSTGLSGKLRAFGSGLYSRQAVRAFDELLANASPDVVHVHELFPLLSPWLLPVCTRHRVPVVMSVYDYRLTCPTHNHYRHGKVCTRCISAGNEWPCVAMNCRGNRAESLAFALRSMVARKADLFRSHVQNFITPTAFAADWLVREAGIAPSRVHVVPCVIDLPDRSVDDPSLGSYALFAGRLVAEKGVQVAIDAARRARIPLRIAVDVAQDLSSVHDDEWVSYVQTKHAGELADVYRGARFLVMPSLWFETFGIVVAEAMAHGVPVLASRIGALAQTTIDGVTGLHFEPGDVDGLAIAMRRLWDDTTLCRELGRQAHEHVFATSSARAHRDGTLAVYAQNR